MAEEGGDKAVMYSHDVEAFAQRGFVVAGCHSLVEVVCYNDMGIDQREGTAASFTHDADAPVKVGRKTVIAVVMNLLCQI